MRTSPKPTRPGALGFGEAQAERYQDGLFNRFRLLAANPRLARERHTSIRLCVFIPTKPT